MKNLYRTLALVAVTVSGPALAADLPSRRAPPVYIPPPIPVFSWTGFYAGGQVGYEFGTDTASVSNTAGVPTAFYSTRPNGVIGGAHIGYNWAAPGLGAGLFGGGLVLGIEGSVDGADDRSTFTTPVLTGVGGALPAGSGFSQTHRKDVEGSIRGRLGIAVDRALFYATGGAAFAQFHDDYAFAIPAGAPPFAGTANGSSTRVGYTVGAGVEYAVTPNWTLRAEYRYTDFGTYGTNISAAFPAFPAGVAYAGTNRITDNRVQVGFSYLFSTAPAVPVVARY